MNKFFRHLGCAALAIAVLAAHGTVNAQAREEARLLTAAEVLDTLRSQQDTLIPERLLQRAYGVAVIPGVTKIAFVLGGRRGSGVLTVRDSRGRFTNPVFVNLTGGSVGWQIGAQESDIVLVFTTRRGIEGIADGKLTLGVGASVAAGPVGRDAEAGAGKDAEVYAYSRSRGVFVGVALNGTALSMDTRGNRAFYDRKDVLPSDIMSGAATSDSQNIGRFLAALARSTGETAETAVADAPVDAVAVPQPATGATPANEVRTFPMEDPSPGGEPPQ
ncbi:MAG TPA: lipid-binding SYLF domain-containing protein [Steroidobacteraceae bacterium]|nr:lipid-binding SYLF domain-containing protein [Steroidobacteraceae bacterium]